MLFELNQKKIKITKSGVYILSPEIQNEIKKKKLSASLINKWLQSPADWVLETYIAPEVAVEEPIHLLRGNWFHSVMEKFFALPPEERNAQNLIQSLALVNKEEKYSKLPENPENMEWIKRALSNYGKYWLDNAKNERIANLFIMGQQKPGLEIFVQGKIGNSNRLCLGFLDKVIEGEYGLLVQDWKTGKTIENFDPTRKISESNSFDYWRQQTLYSMLLEQYGATVEGASLIFPCSEVPTIVQVNQADKKVREQVIADVEQVDKEYEEAINNNFFYPYKKHKYAGWSSWLGGLGRAKKPNVYEDKLMMIAEFES